MPECDLDRFEFQTLWTLFDRVRRTHRVLAFADLAGQDPADNYVVLRHDVDYSLDVAAALAEEEAARGIRATYFLLPSSPYYNLLDPRHAATVSRISAVGHEVGLHYDVNLLRCVDESRWLPLLQLQAALLTELSGQPVISMAMHQPGLNGADPLEGRADIPFLNAYAPRFFREMPYVSDSCRAWRDSAWAILTGDPLPPRFQLALHPLNWGPHNRERTEIYREVHAELTRTIDAMAHVLLAQIDRHDGVLEDRDRRRARRAFRD